MEAAVLANGNIASQADEIEALSAIYQDEWKVEDAADCVYRITLCNENNNHKLDFKVRLPPEYPSDAPPIYEISAPWMSHEDKTRLSNTLEDHYCDHLGENILFDWVEIARKALLEGTLETRAGDVLVDPVALLEINSEVDSTDEPEIFHGDTLEDRRSVFQAHLAEVHNLRQVEQVLNRLKTNRKIAEATHNIWAYRILQTEPRSVLQKDSADDGETYAGTRLLHLLDILDATNVYVVVTRWYGGTHLGPDRYKHINKVARDLLECHGYIKKQGSAANTKGKSKKRNSPAKRN
ncbi:protein IMPACT [Ixodes scapularis]|uniref:Impact, putative n=1 Tax=Ixodes scapularis TaxID=6945 RepID=B7Q5D7_IXOSC|nr:protein IMPACT [Ixodes scapularis]XP_040063133.1 protein IMPACT [Ixodes scapularis]XP_040355704.1 protein IMPACT [Ixodes scapularis]EEC14059.1 impact, putative [Ixodes scapularis]|eukprot:XP_002411741.1 impact, putative [Ixodes scapularis]